MTVSRANLSAVAPLRAEPPTIEAACPHVARLLADLPRKDQRRVGEQYVTALLATAGRKTARGMGADDVSTADEQRLNHFITSSTWQWRDVGSRLRDAVVESMSPAVWVLDDLRIPKSGSRSVGVEMTFDRASGRTSQAQRAFGVWGVHGRVAAPVGWQLHVPDPWLEKVPQACRDGLDKWGGQAQPARTAAAAVDELLSDDLPVVADGRGLDVALLLPALLARRAPFAVRVSGREKVLVTDPLLYTWTGQTLPASRAAAASTGLRRPCAHPGLRSSGIELLRSLRVTVPGVAGELALVIAETSTGPSRSAMWLTNQVDTPLEQIISMSSALAVVRDSREMRTATLGLRDFSGRSYAGWHRHMTLVAVAHYVADCHGAARRLTGGRPDRARAARSHPGAERSEVMGEWSRPAVSA